MNQAARLGEAGPRTLVVVVARIPISYRGEGSAAGSEAAVPRGASQSVHAGRWSRERHRHAAPAGARRCRPVAGPTPCGRPGSILLPILDVAARLTVVVRGVEIVTSVYR